ncbi:hypothetical protein AK88_01488 [Plasmodium fragile]|uniref:Merozoite surface protein 3 n=1 Tax=Plasmodium fragile TaxID=5857 RepID=A0A0D9QPE4_PLAFR|nr:uncharacterized protein AK88_01488 [Plasmodium fragile]KJP88798.1 hypothetical protein AK88_01488 [Plasmodium fragile]
MKRTWSFSLFIFFLNFYVLHYSVANNEIKEPEKPNIRIPPPPHGNNNAPANSGSGGNNSQNNQNKHNANKEKTGGPKHQGPGVPAQGKNEDDKNQIENIVEETELIAEEVQMLADLASTASQKVIAFLGDHVEGKITSESKVDAILTARDAERARKDAIDAAEKANKAQTVTEAKEAKAQAEHAKKLTEFAATLVKESAVRALKEGRQHAQASEVEKMKIPIPEQSKPKKEDLKKLHKNRQAQTTAAKLEATPPANGATSAEKATELPNKQGTKAAAAPAAGNKSNALYEEKSLKEGIEEEAEQDKEQKQEPENESPQQTQTNVFYNVMQFFVSKFKALINFFHLW